MTPVSDPVPTLLDSSLADSNIDIWNGDGVPEVMTKPINILMTSKGLGEIRWYPSYLVIKTPTIPLGIKLHHQLPWQLYAKIVGFFKKVNDVHKAEALVYIWIKDGQFSLTVPRQRISGARVEPLDKLMDGPEGASLWGHIHSHNTMSAFFSSTDDAGEQQDGLIYGVVGEITKHAPMSKWRIRAGGVWTELTHETVVLLPERTYPDPPTEWMDQISTQSTAVTIIDHRKYPGYLAPQQFWNRGGQQRTFDLDTANVENLFQRVIMKDGRVMLLWRDHQLTPAGKRVEDLKAKELKAAYVEGIDWPIPATTTHSTVN